MRHIDIALPSAAGDDVILLAIDRAIAQAGLTATLRGSLKKFGGSTHWHAKLDRQPGTLEITYWPQEHRAWFSIQDGRIAPWIEGKSDELSRAIERLLLGA